jgi:hypothetical protein
MASIHSRARASALAQATHASRAVGVPRSGTIPVGVNPTRAIDCSP